MSSPNTRIGEKMDAWITEEYRQILMLDAFGLFGFFCRWDSCRLSEVIPLFTNDYDEAYQLILDILADYSSVLDNTDSDDDRTKTEWLLDWKEFMRDQWQERTDQRVEVVNTPDRELDNIWTITWKDYDGSVLYEKICLDTIGQDAESIADGLRKAATLDSDERAVCVQQLNKGQVDVEDWATLFIPDLPRPYEPEVKSYMWVDRKSGIYMSKIMAINRGIKWERNPSLQTKNRDVARQRLRSLDTALREWRSIDREIHFNWDCNHSPAVDGRKKCSTCRCYRNLEDFPANSHKCLSCTERQKKQYRHQQNTARMLQNTQRLAAELPEILTRLSEETDEN